MAYWLNSWLAERAVGVAIPCFCFSRDMTEISLKRCKSSTQPTEHPTRSNMSSKVSCFGTFSCNFVDLYQQKD